MRQRASRRPWIYRAMAWGLLPALIGTSVPVPAAAASAEQKDKPEERPTPAPPPKVKVNRSVPQVAPPPALASFSDQPTDAEIFRARVFQEPLVPNGQTTAAENQALASALTTYLKAGSREDTSAVETFLAANPDSAWTPSVLLGLGIVYRNTAHFSKALTTYQRVWVLAKGSEDPRTKAVADRALGELVALHSRLGHMTELEGLFQGIERRPIGGSAAELVNMGRQTLYLMKNDPGMSFRCGPLAVQSVVSVLKPERRDDPAFEKALSTTKGTSLAQSAALAESVATHLQMAKREADAEIPVPSLVHWKAGHFAALLRQEGRKYLLKDPTFGDETWVSRVALNDEASGFFLIRAGALPEGWRSVSAEEGSAVWGKGTPSGINSQWQGPPSNTSCPPMAVYAFQKLLAALYIMDSPVRYSPPIGPPVEFRVSYNQRDVFQPQLFYYANLGPKWTFDWISYVEDDPDTPAQTVNVYLRGGGQETHKGYDPAAGTFAAEFRNHSVMTRVAGQGGSVSYQRQLPDGSLEIFGQPDGSFAFPRKVFLTEWRDSQGNAVKLTYDASLRIVAITDAIGQVTTLSYESSDPLKITKVTDPFGRFATFEYEDSGHLKRITDVIGIASEFTYDAGDFISTLTTPYGTTHFRTFADGNTQWVEASDPLGGTERMQYFRISTAPSQDLAGTPTPADFASLNGNMHLGVTFHWDKRAMALYPNDITKAEQTNWIFDESHRSTGIPRAVKKPLESRVWYRYPGQTQGFYAGTESQPSKVGRLLDDGSSQVYQYEYNSKGLVTRETDPLGRETVYEYGTNEIDLLRIKQKNGSNYDLVSSATHDSQHLPLTKTDAAGQTTTYTYNSAGKLLNIVTPPRGGLALAQRTTTYSYDTNGYLQSVTGPVTGATTSFTYDGYGRVRTTTNSDSYTLTYDYDALDGRTKVTYPDGTYEETVYNRLDAEKQRDRLGRWSETFYDPLRRPVAMRDPLGRMAIQQWCTCGSLDKLIDANGNATTWERDLQGRATREVRANGSAKEFTYDTTTSRLKKVRDAKNQEIQHSYFLDDKLQQVSYVNEQFTTPNVSFTYDVAYGRLASMTDGAGTTTYAYHPITIPPSLGAGSLASVDGPLANDTITYGYDELGRLESRTLNSVTTTWSYDELGRLKTVVDPVGSFVHTYVGAASRLNTVTYPNGQTTAYGYYSNSGDKRLQEIHHKKPGGATLSRFNYTYDVVGNIKNWTQQMDGNPANAYDYGYDAADQLSSAVYRTTDVTPVVLKRYGYAYDPAGNRIAEQVDDAVTGATHDSMNRLISQQPGGALIFKGAVSEPAVVSVGGKPATVSASNQFAGSALVPSGTSTVQVQAADSPLCQ